jgi:hypothetical protein
MAPRDAAYDMAKLLAIGTRSNVVGVNLGGAGEVAGYLNINNGSDGRQAGAIANLIADRAENITRHCQPNSVDHVTANNIVPGKVDWTAVAPGVSSRRSGGGQRRGNTSRASRRHTDATTSTGSTSPSNRKRRCGG